MLSYCIFFFNYRKIKNNTLRKTDNKENETARLTVPKIVERDRKKAESPLYVNINHNKQDEGTVFMDNSRTRYTEQNKMLKEYKQNINDNLITNQKNIDTGKERHLLEKKQEIRPKNEIKKHVPRRTEKLTTPDHIHESIKRSSSNNKSPTNKNNSMQKIIVDKSQTSTKRNERSKNDILNEIPKQRKDINNHDQSKNTLRIKKVNDKATEEILDKSKLSKVAKEPPNSQNSTATNKNNLEKVPNMKLAKQAGSNSRSKRSKYVINYDDKNGTVSSICKIKTGPGTYKRKLITVENKDAQDSNNNNNKSLNKIALRK